jgi:hypothetical protein
MAIDPIMMSTASRLASRMSELEAELADHWRKIDRLAAISTTEGDLDALIEQMKGGAKIAKECGETFNHFARVIESMRPSLAEEESAKSYAFEIDVGLNIISLAGEGELEKTMAAVPVEIIRERLAEHHKACSDPKCPIAAAMEARINAADRIVH